MDQIPMPSGLQSPILFAQAVRQKQAGITGNHLMKYVRIKSSPPLIVVAILAILSMSSMWAVKITGFIDMDMYIKRANDIVVAKCVAIPKASGEREFDGLYLVEVDVVRIIKGNRKPAKLKIATIYPMEVGRVYLLSSLGGSALGTDFLALPELSVVQLSPHLAINGLDGKSQKEQIQFAFSRSLLDLESRLQPLLEEKKLLEKAISDDETAWYVSDGPVKVGRVVETTTKTEEVAGKGPPTVYLDLEAKKMEWSLSEAGKSGFLYFQKIGGERPPYWEFAPCDAANIESMSGKTLKTKFYGIYSPGRRGVGLDTGQSIHISSGKLLLARATDDPRKVFIIQIVQDQESMTARYALIQNR